MGQSSPRRTYRFGPLERRGVVGALRPGQVACLAIGSVGAIVLFRSSPGPLTLMLALAVAFAAAVAAFAPIGGRPIESWTGVLADWLLDGLTTGRRYRSTTPAVGSITRLDGSSWRRDVELPPALAGCRLLAHPIGEQDLG